MKRLLLVIGCMLCASLSTVYAQTPTASQIEKEQQRIEIERKRMFDDKQVTISTVTNNFPNVSTPKRVGIDLEAMVRQYEHKAVAQRADHLMIFASFTMPQESLKRLVHQANRVGASVVLRGFKNNSLKDTALAIHALGEPDGNLVINPKTFAYYKIEAVPTVVLTQAELERAKTKIKKATTEAAEGTGCALPEDFIAISGDVSLDYALEEIAKRAPQWQSQVMPYLKQLQR